MKKQFSTIIIALASLFCSTAASAGDIFNSPDNHRYWGVRLSYELAAPSKITAANLPLSLDLYSAGSGVSVGAIYHMPLWRNLYFQPGASLYYNTYQIDRNLVEQLLDDEISSIIQQPVSGAVDVKSASVRQWGIRIPLHFGYNFDLLPDLRLSVFTGPEISLSISGSNHIGIGNADISTPAFGSDGQLNRADIKWRFGVGATFCHHYSASISGAVGLLDQARDHDYQLRMHSNLFNITLGYNF